VNVSSYQNVQHGKTRGLNFPCQRELGLEGRLPYSEATVLGYMGDNQARQGYFLSMECTDAFFTALRAYTTATTATTKANATIANKTRSKLESRLSSGVEVWGGADCNGEEVAVCMEVSVGTGDRRVVAVDVGVCVDNGEEDD
jgi:hypothetical protein